MAINLTYINSDHTQIVCTLDSPADRLGEYDGPKTFSFGLSAGNKEFDAVFPNAVTSIDMSTGHLTLVDAGTPIFAISDYVAPNPVPYSISDRQFFWGMYKQGMISRDDAMNAIKAGVTPPFIVNILSTIADQSARDDAEALIMGAIQIERANPSTVLFGHQAGMTDAQIDAFFRFCSML